MFHQPRIRTQVEVKFPLNVLTKPAPSPSEKSGAYRVGRFYRHAFFGDESRGQHGLGCYLSPTTCTVQPRVFIHHPNARYPFAEVSDVSHCGHYLFVIPAEERRGDLVSRPHGAPDCLSPAPESFPN